MTESPRAHAPIDRALAPHAASLHDAVRSVDLLDAVWRKTDGHAHRHRDAGPDAVPGSTRRVLDTQRAWIDAVHLLARHGSAQLDAAQHAADPKIRERARRWVAVIAPVLRVACAQQAFRGAGDCLRLMGRDGLTGDSTDESAGEWNIEPSLHAACAALAGQTSRREASGERQDAAEAFGEPSVELSLLRDVLADSGTGMSTLLIGLRDALDASRETDADVQRRLAQLRYLTTTVAMASHAAPGLPDEVAEDYLRVLAITLLAWAWARIDVEATDDADAPAASAEAGRPSRASSAFRRWVLPEFELRLGIVKRACDTVIAAQVAAV